MSQFKSRKQRVCRYAGYAALISAVMYAAGFPTWWMPIDDAIMPSGRGFVLFLLHAGGICAGLFSMDNDMWDKDR